MQWNGEKPVVASPPKETSMSSASEIPRFDLLQHEAYDSMSVQFSRLPLQLRVLRHHRSLRFPPPSRPFSSWCRTAISARPGLGARSIWWTTTSSATSATRLLPADPRRQEEWLPPSLRGSGRRRGDDALMHDAASKASIGHRNVEARNGSQGAEQSISTLLPQWTGSPPTESA